MGKVDHTQKMMALFVKVFENTETEDKYEDGDANRMNFDVEENSDTDVDVDEGHREKDDHPAAWKEQRHNGLITMLLKIKVYQPENEEV